MSSTNIQTAVKVRPLIERELKDKVKPQWLVKENSIIHIDSAHNFLSDPYSFDHIFDQNTSNKEVYDAVVKPLVMSFLEGINSTIFAYGQTSSGKTHTMLGGKEVPGIINFAVEDIFNYTQAATTKNFLIRCSYLEIYNEKINDLLDTNAKDLKIRENVDQGVYVQVKEEVIRETYELFSLMKKGMKTRKIGCTDMNERSSRSHTIFKLVIQSQNKDSEGSYTESSLNLVDLAGSERVGQMKMTGERQAEGVSINKSLTTLGLVIRKLSDNDQFINYRDSKLTRLLQDSLGGNSRTLIICTVTVAASEETKSTLEFAQRAKYVKNCPIINEKVTDKDQLKQYAHLCQDYKGQIEKLRIEKLEREKTINALEDKISNIKLFSVGNVEKVSKIPQRRHTLGTYKPAIKKMLEPILDIEELEVSSDEDVQSEKGSYDKINNIVSTPCQALSMPENSLTPKTPSPMLRIQKKLLEESYDNLKTFTSYEQHVKQCDEIEELRELIEKLRDENIELKQNFLKAHKNNKTIENNKEVLDQLFVLKGILEGKPVGKLRRRSLYTIMQEEIEIIPTERDPINQNDQIDNANEKCLILAEENHRLRKQLEDKDLLINSNYSSFTKEKEILEAKCSSLSLENNQLKDQLKCNDVTITNLQTSIRQNEDIKEAELEILTKKIKQLNDYKEEMHTQLSELKRTTEEQSNNDFKADLENLRKKYDELKQLAEYETFKIGELEEDKQRLQTELTGREKHLGEKSRSLEEMTAMMQKGSETITDLQNDIKEQRNIITEFENKHQTQQKEILDLQNLIILKEDRIAELEKSQNDLKVECDKYNKDYLANKVKYEAIEQEKADMERKIDELTKIETEYLTVVNHIKGIADEDIKILDYIIMLEALKNDNHMLRTEQKNSEKQQKEILDLQNLIILKEDRIAEMEKSQNDLKVECNKYNEDYLAIKLKYEAIEQEKDNMEKKIDKLTEIETEYFTVVNHIKGIVDDDIKVIDYITTLEALKNDNHVLRTKQENSEKLVIKLSIEIENLKKEINGLDKDSNLKYLTLEKDNEDLKNLIASNNAIIINLQKEQSILQELNKKNQPSLNRLEEENNNLAKEVVERLYERETLETQLAFKIKELKRVKMDRKDLILKIKKAESEIVDVKCCLDKSYNELSLMRDKCSGLELQFSNYKDQMESKIQHLECESENKNHLNTLIESKNIELASKLEDVMNKLNQSQEENETIKLNLKAASDEIERLKQTALQVKTVQAENKQYKEEMEKEKCVYDENRFLNNAISNLTEEKQLIEKDLYNRELQYQQDLNKLNNELQRLIDLESQLKIEQSKVETLKNKLELEESKTSKYLHEKENLETQIVCKSEELKKVEIEKTTLMIKIEEAENGMLDVTCRLDKCNKELSLMKEKYNNLEKQFSNYKDPMEAKIQNLEDELAKIKHVNTLSENKNIELVSKLEALIDKLSQTQEENRTKTITLNTAYDEISSLKQKIISVQDEFEKYKMETKIKQDGVEENLLLMKTISNLTEQKRLLEKELSNREIQYQQEKTNLNQKLHYILDLESQLKVEQSNSESLSHQLEIEKSKIGEYLNEKEMFEIQIVSKSEELKKIEKEKFSLMLKLNEAEQNLLDITCRLDQCRNELLIQKKMCNDLEKQFNNYKEQITAKVEALQNEVEKNKQVKTLIENKNMELLSKLEDAMNKLNQTQNDNKFQSVQLKIYSDEIQKLKQNSQNLATLEAELEQHKIKLNEKYNAYEKNIDSLKNMISKLTDEKLKLEKELLNKLPQDSTRLQQINISKSGLNLENCRTDFSKHKSEFLESNNIGYPYEKENLEVQIIAKCEELGKAEKKMQGLKSRLDQSSEELSHIKGKYNALEVQFREYKDLSRAKIQSLENKVEETRRFSCLYEKKNSELITKLENVTSKLNQAQEENLIKTNQLKIVTDEIQTIKQNLNVQTLQAELERYKKERQYYEEKMCSLKGIIIRLTEEKRILENKYTTPEDPAKIKPDGQYNVESHFKMEKNKDHHVKQKLEVDEAELEDSQSNLNVYPKKKRLNSLSKEKPSSRYSDEGRLLSPNRIRKIKRQSIHDQRRGLISDSSESSETAAAECSDCQDLKAKLKENLEEIDELRKENKFLDKENEEMLRMIKEKDETEDGLYDQIEKLKALTDISAGDKELIRKYKEILAEKTELKKELLHSKKIITKHKTRIANMEILEKEKSSESHTRLNRPSTKDRGTQATCDIFEKYKTAKKLAQIRREEGNYLRERLNLSPDCAVLPEDVQHKPTPV